MTHSSLGPFRIATFNLKDFFDPASEAEHAIADLKLEEIARQLRRANADVVALQEVGSEDRIGRLVERLGDLGYRSSDGVIVGTPDRRGIRNALLTRLPVEFQEIVTTPQMPFPVFAMGDEGPFSGRLPLRRGIVHVRVTVEGAGPVDVIAAHFKSHLPARKTTEAGEEVADSTLFESGESAVRSMVLRCAEALLVRKRVDDLLADDSARLVCVAGDLNDTVDSLPVRLVRGMSAAASGSLSAASELVPLERRFSFVQAHGVTLIDHLLLSRALRERLQTCELYNESLRHHGPFSGAIPMTADSDHAVCVAEFSR